jgi:hypothetical protein
MARTGPEAADILRCYGEAYHAQHDASLPAAQRRVMSPIELCRTAHLAAKRRVDFGRLRDSSASAVRFIHASANPPTPICRSAAND